MSSGKSILTAVVLGGMAMFLLWRIFQEYHINKVDGDGLNELKAQVAELKAENEKTRKNVEYYSDPDNLEKELRARFNLKKLDEHILIVVPKAENGGTDGE